MFAFIYMYVIVYIEIELNNLTVRDNMINQIDIIDPAVLYFAEFFKIASYIMPSKSYSRYEKLKTWEELRRRYKKARGFLEANEEIYGSIHSEFKKLNCNNL